MIEYSYCDSWFWKKRKPVEVLTASEARKRHGKREQYTVVLGGFEKPSEIILLAKGLVAVTFPDALIRRALAYHFEEEETGQCFLAMAIRRQYCPATPAMVTRLEAGRKNPDQPWGQFLAEVDKVIEGTSVTFQVDDSALRIQEHFAEPYSLEKAPLQCDVSKHWEPYPEFGQYDRLLKRDRDVPWGPGIDD